MGLCSYVEKRRERYYFRVRRLTEAAGILGRTHVVGSLLSNDSRVAKLRASRFYFEYVGLLTILTLRMRDNAHSSEMRHARDIALVQAAFKLGRRFEVQKEQLRQSD